MNVAFRTLYSFSIVRTNISFKLVYFHKSLFIVLEKKILILVCLYIYFGRPDKNGRRTTVNISGRDLNELAFRSRTLRQIH